MMDAGLIEEAGPSARRTANDERRRYYRLTRLGRQVAKAEARRLAALVAVARDKALLTDR
jgi:DNA-binding MarR family transcriptional regulator